MITLTQLRDYKNAQPFRPFRLHMASGRTFDIRHPEMVHYGKNHILVFSFDVGESDVLEKWETVSMMLTESISHLDQSVAA